MTYAKAGTALSFTATRPAETPPGFYCMTRRAIGSDAYGKEKNRAKWMEAKYCTWIVDRFSMYYLAIEP